MKTLMTGFGFWNPLIWLIAFIVIYLIVNFFVKHGKEDTEKEGDMLLPFTSGNYVSEEDMHIRASNVYWGFMEAMKGYYNLMAKMHTGIMSDYVYWYISVLAIIIILIGVGK